MPREVPLRAQQDELERCPDGVSSGLACRKHGIFQPLLDCLMHQVSTSLSLCRKYKMGGDVYVLSSLAWNP